MFKVADVDKQYERWVRYAEDAEIKKELLYLKENKNELRERFHKIIEFGTAGLRGMMGAGTNRMNIYTVRLATQGLANFLLDKYPNDLENLSVAISYDSRNNSKLFAKETAKVMAGNGIKSYITENLSPTPFLSFCVRKLKTKAGVMITASHNTAEYNGYKCYGEDGAQMAEIPASEVYAKISKLDIFKNIKILDFDVAKKQNLIEFISDDIYKSYLENVMNQCIINFPISNLCVAYTPLNGAGNNFVKEVLEKSGIKDLYVVSSQENPDGNFTTCPYPNPENIDAFSEALKLAKGKNADIILATDPDSDRLGICVKHDEKYKILSGNEIGVLIFNYILNRRKETNTLPKDPVCIKSIVSTMMVNKIADCYGCEVKEVLTGFKNIASEILKLEKLGKEKDYIFGFEESNGYLLGTYARDKDAVSAALLVCEMASYYKNKNKDLYEVLCDLWNRYGFFGESTLSFEFKGLEGKKIIDDMMRCLRGKALEQLSGMDILKIHDYLNSTTFDVKNNEYTKNTLPYSNIIRFDLKNGCKIIVRPSGTEPKIKFYLIMESDDKEKLNSCKINIKNEIEHFVIEFSHKS